MTVSKNTVTWWEAQGEEARVILETGQVDILEALIKFGEWYGPKSLPTWGNGANFDNPIMENAFRVVGMKCPWDFWDSRCFRTIRSMFRFKWEFSGTKHYALDDAIHQANILIEIQRCFSK
jgi:hypothetical protein